MPGKITWFNTTVYIKATTFFGQIYSKAVNDEMFALNATEVRLRCRAEHMIEDKYYDLELQVHMEVDRFSLFQCTHHQKIQNWG